MNFPSLKDQQPPLLSTCALHPVFHISNALKDQAHWQMSEDGTIYKLFSFLNDSVWQVNISFKAYYIISSINKLITKSSLDCGLLILPSMTFQWSGQTFMKTLGLFLCSELKVSHQWQNSTNICVDQGI